MARPALTPVGQVGKGFSVATALAAYSEEQLLTLLRVRPDLADPAPRDLAFLAVRTATWSSINACMDTLNRGCRQLLDALCLLPQPATVASLTNLLATEVDIDDLEAALTRLADRALIFRKGRELRLHPQLLGLPSPGGLGPALSVALSTQQVSTLDAVARRLGAKPGPTKVDTMVTLIDILNDPDLVHKALVSAPPGAADLAARMSEHAVGTVSTGTYNIRPESPLGWLAGRGFIFATDWDTVVMPREVGLALRGGRPFPNFTLRPPAIRWHPVDVTSVERASTEQALRVVADIATILDGWEEAPPKLLKAGGVGIRDIRRAATAVGRSEVEAARLMELAAIAGLAGWDDEATAALPCTAYDDWLELEAPERWLALVHSWLAVDVHLNLAGATGTNGKAIPPLLTRWGEAVSRHRRRVVLAAMLTGEPGQAADNESLLARVQWDAPGIWTEGPARPPMLVSWVREEAQMLGICAAGAISTLGRAVVTGEVEQAMAELTAHAPRVTSQFVIQADLTAVATGPLTTAVRADLELMADLESSGAATVYRFSEQSLRRAFDAGWTADPIIGFLDVHATKGVPQPLEYLVEDVARRHGRVRVGSASCYIRSDEPSLVAEMLMARKTAKLGLRQLAPTVLVSTADPETVIATLRATGYLPAEEDDTGALMVRRREVVRADEGYGPLSARSFDPEAGATARNRAAQLTDLLAHPDGVTSFSSTPAGDRAVSESDLKSLVRRLRSPHLSGGSGSQPSIAPLPRHPLDGATTSIRAPAPVSQLELLQSDTDRPQAIANSRAAILELLELAHMHDWWLRLEYAGRAGTQQLNATVFGIDGTRVTVGTMPGYGTRTLSLNLITWARAMTEAEEAAL
jgi:hypothetical protein